MPLEPGTRLGPYAVVSPLGSGGMGEVYRARDTRLHRVVAIKTLSGRLESGVQSPWITSLDGGKPTQLANVYAFQPVASPDGTSVAFVSLDEQRKSLISMCALPDCSSRRDLPVARRPLALQWTQDGRGLAYSILSNIWVQPLDGGAPYQLTHFPEDDHRIEDFEWSPDGKRLAFSRSRTTWDIVLFRGLKLD